MGGDLTAGLQPAAQPRILRLLGANSHLIVQYQTQHRLRSLDNILSNLQQHEYHPYKCNSFFPKVGPIKFSPKFGAKNVK